MNLVIVVIRFYMQKQSYEAHLIFFVPQIGDKKWDLDDSCPPFGGQEVIVSYLIFESHHPNYDTYIYYRG